MENTEKVTKGTLKMGEPHPMAYFAKEYIKGWGIMELMVAQEAMAFCAIEGNRAAEVCGETLDRLMKGLPVSDRYLMGLAFMLSTMDNDIKDKLTRAISGEDVYNDQG